MIDPPWENKSVERSREKKLRRASTDTAHASEATVLSSISKEEEHDGDEEAGEESMNENETGAYDTLPPHALKSIPLDQLVAENGIVCIW